MKNTIISILILIAALGSITCRSAETEDSVIFRFRQGRHELDSTFRNNGSELRRLKAVLESGKTASGIKAVRILGTASPEGGVGLNSRLSDSRAMEIKKRLSGWIPDSLISTAFTGRDWQGLRRLVQKDRELPGRDEVCALLDRIIFTDSLEGTEKESFRNLELLKQIGGGASYRYMYDRLFPDLRTSGLHIEYYRPLITDNIPMPGLETGAAPVPVVREIIPFTFGSTTERRNFYMSVKTNLLYDALALPTIGAEFYLGKNFSIAGEWTYGWWDTDRKHRYWRAYGGDLSLRWWFGRAAETKPLTGHHLGIYGGVVTYDFEFGGEGQMGGLPGKTLWDRCQRMAGIEYGYSLPIGSRLNLDFTIGIGYLGGKYIKYEPSERGYIWKSTHKRNWLGPTKAEISLVWLIGHGNRNVKKGGDR